MNDGLTWIGSPIEVFRVVHTVHVDEARHDFPTYLRQTLSGSQRQGGRFNPPGEFGALYTSTDEETAWVEVAARFEREGIPGLPPVADAILAPSARAAAANMPLFPDRDESELALELQAVSHRGVPDRLAQRSNEPW